MTSTAINVSKVSIDRNRVEIALDNDPKIISQHTKRCYTSDLLEFEDWRNGKPLKKKLVTDYAAHLRKVRGLSASTVNRKLSAIRWYARKLHDLAYDLPLSDAQRKQVVEASSRVASVEDLKEDNKASADVGNHIKPGELNALLDACLNDKWTETGTRDAAIIAMAYQVGMRRSELCKLRYEDLEFDNDETVVNIKNAKGDKSRTVYLYGGAMSYLMDWLQLRGDAPGPLFYAILKGGHIRTGHAVGTQSLMAMLNKRLRQAGVKDDITWHDFRRTCIGNLLDVTDIATVQKIAGHADPKTTASYDKRPKERRKEALRNIHVAYR